MFAEATHATLLRQRSTGAIKISVGQAGLIDHREDGCLKLRIPQASNSGIIINTSGGLAGGDTLSTDLSVNEGGNLSITSQSAERVYGSIGPPAKVALKFDVAANANLAWLPHETILYDNSFLSREMTVTLAPTATFLALETFVLGRTEMGERMSRFQLRDNWTIMRDNQLCHAERLLLSHATSQSPATLGGAKAFATLLLISEHAATMVEEARHVIGSQGAISCWNGKLLARLVAEDGFCLKKCLLALVSACAAGMDLPHAWTQ